MCRKSEIPDSGLQGNNFLDPPYNIAKSCVQPINAIPNLAPIFPIFFPHPKHQMGQILDPEKPNEDPRFALASYDFAIYLAYFIVE